MPRKDDGELKPREIPRLKRNVGAPARREKAESKKQAIPTILDTLTHIPEQLLDAEAKMMQQVQTQMQPDKGLEKELERARKLAEDRLEQIKYLQSDFENYRKRTEKERGEFAKCAGEGVVKDLLPFLDELEIAISAVQDQKMKESFEMLQKNFLKILQSRGLEKIESMGKKLDPYYHEVVMAQPSDKEEGTIIMEVQKGYKISGRVLRAAKVVVSAGSPSNEEKQLKEGERAE